MTWRHPIALVETNRMPSAGVAEGEVVSFVTWEINPVDNHAHRCRPSTHLVHGQFDTRSRSHRAFMIPMPTIHLPAETRKARCPCNKWMDTLTRGGRHDCTSFIYAQAILPAVGAGLLPPPDAVAPPVLRMRAARAVELVVCLRDVRDVGIQPPIVTRGLLHNA